MGVLLVLVAFNRVLTPMVSKDGSRGVKAAMPPPPRKALKEHLALKRKCVTITNNYIFFIFLDFQNKIAETREEIRIWG